jgi:DNA polymerase-3 subunit delta
MHAAIGEARPVCAVVGGDPFLRHEALDRLLQELAAEMDSLGPTRLGGLKAELAEVLDEVRTTSLLGGLRVVIVEDADAFISANRAALERYCSSPSESGVLILLCNSLPKNTRIHRIIKGTGLVVQVDAPKGRAILGWIVNRARAVHGKRVAQPAASMLREQVGDAPGRLDAELAKLTAFVGEREEIAPADIDALTGHHREEKVFAVTDAMSSRDTTAALRNWEQVLATDRAAPGRAVAGLAWGVRRLLEARRDWEGGVGIRELAARMRTDPEVLRQRLERVTIEQLETQQRDLLAVDLAVKTGASTVDVAIEKFIVKHSADVPAAR